MSYIVPKKDEPGMAPKEKREKAQGTYKET